MKPKKPTQYFLTTFLLPLLISAVSEFSKLSDSDSNFLPTYPGLGLIVVSVICFRVYLFFISSNSIADHINY